MSNPGLAREFLRTVGERTRETEEWLRRGALQIEFARAFAKALPVEETATWAEAIDRAEGLISSADPAEGPDSLRAATLAAEGAMAPIGQVAKSYFIHCVGHGHIDMNWMWSWPETVATTHDTFASVLSFMEQYPDVTYSQSQTAIYALVERYYPEMFEQIVRRVKEGRWEVTATHWVEGDKNLASGESLCRHLLLSRTWCREKFGLEPEDLPVDWEPDTFGHASTVPSILAQAGIKYYYSCRLGGGFGHLRLEERRPPLFHWRAPNGATVLINHEQTWYNSYVNIGDNVALPLAESVSKTGLHHWLNIFGIGNHGGGPTRHEIDYLHRLQELPVYPSLVFSTSKRFFDAIAEEMAHRTDDVPTVSHELNFEFTGCYTSQSAIKRANRLGENYLEDAETLAVLGSQLYGMPYPAAQLREAWSHILFNQFHDILPGSGVTTTRQHALALFQEVGAITGSIKRRVGLALTSRIDTVSLLPLTPEGERERSLLGETPPPVLPEGEGRLANSKAITRLAGESGSSLQRRGSVSRVNTPFESGAGVAAGETGYSAGSSGGRYFRPYVIYNPTSWSRSEPVTVALYDTGFEPSSIVAIDDAGQVHPLLVIGQTNDSGHQNTSVLLAAPDIPALGYRTYLFCQKQTADNRANSNSDAPPPVVRHLDDEGIETPFFKARYDVAGSGLRELIDSRTGASFVLGEGFGRWEYVTERPIERSAWILGDQRDPPVPLVTHRCRVIGDKRNQANDNPLAVVSPALLVKHDLRVPGTESSVRLTMTLHALTPRIDVEAEIDWREIGTDQRGIPGLVLRIPLALSDIVCRYEVPFGSVERDLCHGEETPSLRYATVEGTATNGKRVAFTLLQDCKYGHSVTKVTSASGTGAELCLRIVRSSYSPDHAPEVAKSTVRYAFFLHDTPPTAADLARLGAAWNHPFLVLPANIQTGDAPAQRSYVRVDSPNVVLTALKQAEDGNGIILRLVEMDGRETEAEVTFDSALLAGLTSVSVQDILERPVPGQATLSSGILRVRMPALTPVTVRISA